MVPDNIKKQTKPYMLPNLLFFGLLRKNKYSIDIINRTYALYYWSRCTGLKQFILVLNKFLLSPFAISKDVGKWSTKIGSTKSSHKSLFRQRIEQFYLAYCFSITPKDYYRQEFYRKDGMERARHYLNRLVIKKGVYVVLRAYAQQLKNDEKYLIDKKTDFYKACLQTSLPTVPILLEFLADGTINDYRSTSNISGKLPEEDIICKPDLGRGGKGVEAWFWTIGQSYQNSKGEILSEKHLRDRLLGLAREHECKSYIMQPLIMPHQELLPFRKKATPTLRIITYVDIEGQVKIGEGHFKFAFKTSSVAPNRYANTLIAAVDLETGTLGTAVHFDINRPDKRLEKIAGSNTIIKGLVLPFWREAVELVRHAHNTLSNRLILGWDLIITERGPLLLEANIQLGLDFPQKAHRFPAGKMEFGVAMAAHLRNAVKLHKNEKPLIAVLKRIYDAYIEW
jgi:hypothetical protein